MDSSDDGLSLIVTIVAQGCANKVIEAARANGADGGTIIHARGSGIHDRQGFFNVVIEPEKDIVLSLVRNAIVPAVLDGISRAVDIEKPGNGIAFTIDASRVIGINHFFKPAQNDNDKNEKK